MTALPHTPLIILGAGFSGIATAIQAERLLSLASYEIYDKSPSLGGTWALNTYRTSIPPLKYPELLCFLFA